MNKIMLVRVVNDELEFVPFLFSFDFMFLIFILFYFCFILFLFYLWNYKDFLSRAVCITVKVLK